MRYPVSKSGGPSGRGMTVLDRGRRRLTAAAFPAAVGVVAAVVFAGTAGADPVSPLDKHRDRYCAELEVLGWELGDKCDLVNVAGFGQCGHFLRGRSARDAMETPQTMFGASPELARDMLIVAVDVYCPVYSFMLDDI